MKRPMSIVVAVATLFVALCASVFAQDAPGEKKNSANEQVRDLDSPIRPFEGPGLLGRNLPPPSPPSDLTADDKWLDDGKSIVVRWKLSPEDKTTDGDGNPVDSPIEQYVVFRAADKNGAFQEVAFVKPDRWMYEDGEAFATIGKCEPGQEYYFRVRAARADAARSEYIEAGPIASAVGWLDASRFFMGGFTAIISVAVLYWIVHARRGKPLKIRKIAGLEAVDEAVGRATEMGRSCMFIPGIQDMNDIQTIAGLTILARVAKVAAEYDAQVEVPTARALVMTAARETVQAAFLAAGRPDAFNEDNIYYVTDEQFGYVAYLSGMMVRKKPAACFYMGTFFAESLILAETGNSIGAIQVAGTAMPSQLPFFVAACDYTLIGEEFFAASAYLSGEPEQLGSLKGQDVGKLITAALIVVGCSMATVARLADWSALEYWVHILKDTVLS